jgi:UDP-N-acetylmuramoyl-L-alanyl-D-glutamate--2,6-diaminopimelate ligase
MILKEIFRDIPLVEQHGDFTREVSALCYRSCDVKPGDLFFAWQGEKTDGHGYIDEAVKRGAVALVTEKQPRVSSEVVWARADSVRRALALASANFFHRPAHKLEMIGVTGTNGKTSTATLLHYLLERSGLMAGLLGTVEYRIGSRRVEASRTTPESHDLQQMLAQMLEQKCRAAVMEVSSHALALDRVSGIPFKVAIFTNLTQDHLDFHRNMEAYFQAKERLFTGLLPGATAIINLDDPSGLRLLERMPVGVNVRTYSIKHPADYGVENLHCTDKGISFRCVTPQDSLAVKIPWLGEFNVSNILAAIAAGQSLGLTSAQLAGSLPEAPCVPGRMERVSGSADFQVLVDYAHTDDAVRRLLESLRPLTRGRLRILIGCGGDRDATKRPLMARVACRLADDVFFTSDNPRGENPLEILRQMTEGVRDCPHYQVIEDREKAIASMIAAARAGDVLVLAGKGHENTQEINGVKIPFSDVVIASNYLKGERL